jgi:UTP:GlnB (protein PII) uridylyltransferase
MLADVQTDADGTVGPSEVVDVKPIVTIERCEEKAYSVVNVKCKDRPKLLFDIVCTLTDMQFVVFHASITSDGPYGLQVMQINVTVV